MIGGSTLTNNRRTLFVGLAYNFEKRYVGSLIDEKLDSAPNHIRPIWGVNENCVCLHNFLSNTPYVFFERNSLEKYMLTENLTETKVKQKLS